MTNSSDDGVKPDSPAVSTPDKSPDRSADKPDGRPENDVEVKKGANANGSDNNRPEGEPVADRASSNSSSDRKEVHSSDSPERGGNDGPGNKESSSGEGEESSKEPRRPTRRGSRGGRGGARRGPRAEKFADKELLENDSTESGGETATEGSSASEGAASAGDRVEGSTDREPRKGSRRGSRGGARRGRGGARRDEGAETSGTVKEGDENSGAQKKEATQAKTDSHRRTAVRREPRSPRRDSRRDNRREPRPKINRNVKKEILVNSTPFETRIALMEDGRLAEFYVDRANRQRGITGNIYKGKIVRVLPGMQSAFVEIGLARTAFFHVSDIKRSMAGFDEEGEKEPERNAQGVFRIQDMIKEGQEVMVQVAKEPIGTKGARVTSYVSLPGRYLVFMPTYGKIAVSRRISSDKERRRLKDIVHNLRPKGCGFIIRTVCEGVSREEIEADMNFLIKLWDRIQNNRETVSNPGVLYEELDLSLRMIRDTFSSDIGKLIIDSKEEYERASKFIDEFMPFLAPRVELFEGGEELFDANGIDIEIGGAVDRKVWLRSGGHLVIDQMEALTAIDVNTGKYVGKKNSDQTILKTNLEAVVEVVYQLRLRNIGGIIVIDFIDMERLPDREKVYNELREALRADKARTNILKISELGIVEMTRKRVRESLSQSLCEPCPYCEGNAIVRHVDTVIMDIFRDMLRELPHKKKKATIYVSPAVAKRFKTETAVLDELNRRFPGRSIEVKSVDRFHQERYEIF